MTIGSQSLALLLAVDSQDILVKVKEIADLFTPVQSATSIADLLATNLVTLT
jgi:hypothetical protein